MGICIVLMILTNNGTCFRADAAGEAFSSFVTDVAWLEASGQALLSCSDMVPSKENVFCGSRGDGVEGSVLTELVLPLLENRSVRIQIFPQAIW